MDKRTMTGSLNTAAENKELKKFIRININNSNKQLEEKQTNTTSKKNPLNFFAGPHFLFQ
jgi:hypothetical protein